MRNSGKKRKGKKVFRTVLIILLIILAAGAWIARKRGVFDGSESGSQNGFLQYRSAGSIEQLKSEKVSRGSIRSVAEGDGVIEGADSQVFTADYPLIVDDVKVENGDVVKEGDVIATLNEDSIEDQLDETAGKLNEVNASIVSLDDSGSDVLTAPVSGRVKRIYIHSGEMLSSVSDEYGGIMEIAADGQLKVEFDCSRKLTPGEDVTVSFLNYDVDGYLLSCADGKGTALIDDAYEYPVDQTAVVKDSQGNTLGEGELKSNRPYLVTASYGKADDIRVELNAHVSAGDTLLTRTERAYNSDYEDLLEQRQKIIDDQQKLNALKKNPEITAGERGIVSDINISDASMMTEKQAVYTIINTDRFYLKAQIDELDIAGVREGQDAEIVFDAMGDQTFKGTVEKISAIGNNTNGVTTYTVTISVDGTEDMKTNMSATASIVTDSRDDVLLVPVDAVQTNGSEKYVTVLKNDGTRQNVDVETGLVNNSMAQITNGDISEGDTIVVYSSSAEEELRKMMMGGNETSGNSAGSSS